MPKLNQILAVEKTVKSRVERRVTDLHKISQKADLFEGFVKTYKPTDDDGETLPKQEKRVQQRAPEVLSEVSALLTELFDVVAAKDATNTVTKAKVVVDGVTLIDEVPVSYLLFLEKQLNDVDTFVRKIPVLDPAERWIFSEAQNLFGTEASKTNRTAKMPRVLVKYEATEEHPAQTDVYYEDVTVGQYQTLRYSGALSKEQQNAILERVAKLKKAVKFAREEANAVDIVERKVGRKVLGYLFDPA